MDALALVALSATLLLAAYLTYARFLSRRIFTLDDSRPTPAHTEEDGTDYVPTKRSVVFGHHFTSIAGTGPIVGPAIAVMWGWLPAVLWVVFGSIFVGAVHDLGSLVVSLRNRGRSIGDIAGDLLGPRVRILFLLILIVGLWIVLAIFGLVIAAVLRQYPAAIFPVLFQIPLAIVIGLVVHRKGRSIVLPSAVALLLMFASVVFGDTNFGPTIADLHAFNLWAAAQPTWIWVVFLLTYSYIASVLPVWLLLQPRDYINALQLIASLGLIVAGLVAAAFFGGAAEGAPERPELAIVAPAVDWQPEGAPPLFPVLFITIACGACSGFHCLVSSGTTSKQLARESDARAVGYGSMLTEGFLATLVIAACAAGIGLAVTQPLKDGWARVHSVETEWRELVLPEWQDERTILVDMHRGNAQTAIATSPVNHAVEAELAGAPNFSFKAFPVQTAEWTPVPGGGLVRFREAEPIADLQGPVAFRAQYQSWSAAGGLANTVGAFVQGAANFLAALGIPFGVATALMGVMVASFAATTLDTACRLQRYVLQELSFAFLPKAPPNACPSCGYDLGGARTRVEGRGSGVEGLDQYDDSAHTVLTTPNAPSAAQPTEPQPPTPDPRPSTHTQTTLCPECGAQHPADEIYHHRKHAAFAQASWLNPFKVLSTIHGATAFAVVSAFLLAMLPTGLEWPTSNAGVRLGFVEGLKALLETGGSGGLILWPLFGATNQLLAGFAFVVITAWLLARRKPVWFIIPPAILMLAVPASAMAWQAYIGNEANPSWLEKQNYLLVTIATITLALEAWLLIEIAIRWRKRSPAHTLGLDSA